MEKQVFSTKYCSRYFLNESGIWIRRKFNGEVIEGCTYVGSIDCSVNSAFYHREEEEEENTYNFDRLNAQILSGEVLGFVPKFVRGFVPFGFYDISIEEILYFNGKLKFSDNNLKKFSFHLGDEISAILLEVSPFNLD